jgi:hypothetical protein
MRTSAYQYGIVPESLHVTAIDHRGNDRAFECFKMLVEFLKADAVSRQKLRTMC